MRAGAAEKKLLPYGKNPMQSGGFYRIGDKVSLYDKKLCPQECTTQPQATTLHDR